LSTAKRAVSWCYVLSAYRVGGRYPAGVPSHAALVDLIGGLAYGELAAGVFHDVFRLDGTPRQHLARVAWKALRRSPISVRHLASDGWAGVRAL